MPPPAPPRAPPRDDVAAADDATVAVIRDGRVIERLGEVAAPTPVIYGAGDALISPPCLHPMSTTEAVAEAAHAAPGAEAVLLPDAGHLAMREQPDAVHVRLVVLGQVAPPRGSRR